MKVVDEFSSDIMSQMFSLQYTLSVSSSGCCDSVSGEGVVELKLSSVKSMSDTSLLAERTPEPSHGRSFRPKDTPSFFSPDEALVSSSSS